MDFYIDIKIKPDAEMRASMLLNKVYSKLHKALFDINADDVGVSFPETKILLGHVLRIHSNKKKLLDLDITNWLGGLVSYCDKSDVLIVQEEFENRRVSRWQSNMSEAHLRRLILRGSIDAKEVKGYKAKMFAAQMTTLPFLELESASNGKRHRRYIKVSKPQNESVLGKFDTFGLSKTATIPWF